FCKILDNRSDYHTGTSNAYSLRKRVFDFGAQHHPVVSQREGIFEHDLASVRNAIQDSLQCTWDEIDAKLFCDVMELQRLRTYQPVDDPLDLLSIYNVTQTQAALYRATHVVMDVTEKPRSVLQQAKLAGLMHRIEKRRDGYRFYLDGPQSGLRETSRYGIRFARMLPTLLTMSGWRLTAHVLSNRGRPHLLRIRPQDGLRAVDAIAPNDFDSSLEFDVDAHWNAHPVEGWSWKREDELLHNGQSIVTPDFTLKRISDAATLHVEIVGFWTPEYMTKKCGDLARFQDRRWLLIVPKTVKPEHRDLLQALNMPIVEFRKRDKPETWLRAAGFHP
ncbi:MAG: DUF790 family protein, partial [Planctomycetota bacterium]